LIAARNVDSLAGRTGAVARLGDLLRQKAGVTEPGPYEVVSVDYDGEYPVEGLTLAAASSC
jgi:hypothetical protein